MERKSDPRIYIIIFLFLSFIVSGGVLLTLYVVLPLSKPLYLMAGMVLVGIPWVFWFLAYLYRCIIKPCTTEISRETHPNKDDNVKTSKNETISAPGGSPDSVAESDDDPRSARTPRDGERHVQFGGVTVIGDEEENSTNNLIKNRSDDVDDADVARHLHREDHQGSSFSKESDQMPFRLSIAVSC